MNMNYVSVGKINAYVNEINHDPESDESHIHWEISRDWTAMFFRRSTIILYKVRKCDYKITEIANHRKQAGFEGELLVVWNSGERDWSPVSQVYNDNYQELVESYLPKKTLTKELMEFGLYEKQQQAIAAELKDKLEKERKDNEKLKLQKKQPTKRKLDNEYTVTKKREKNIHLNKKVDSTTPKSRTTRSSIRSTKSHNLGNNSIKTSRMKRASKAIGDVMVKKIVETTDVIHISPKTLWNNTLTTDECEIDLHNMKAIRMKETKENYYETIQVRDGKLYHHSLNKNESTTNDITTLHNLNNGESSITQLDAMEQTSTILTNSNNASSPIQGKYIRI